MWPLRHWSVGKPKYGTLAKYSLCPTYICTSAFWHGNQEEGKITKLPLRNIFHRRLGRASSSTQSNLRSIYLPFSLLALHRRLHDMPHLSTASSVEVASMSPFPHLHAPLPISASSSTVLRVWGADGAAWATTSER
jgi:hypothetical protein